MDSVTGGALRIVSKHAVLKQLFIKALVKRNTCGNEGARTSTYTAGDFKSS